MGLNKPNQSNGEKPKTIHFFESSRTQVYVKLKRTLGSQKITMFPFLFYANISTKNKNKNKNLFYKNIKPLYLFIGVARVFSGLFFIIRI